MRPIDSNLTQDQLKKILSYDPETGIFTWLVDQSFGARAGTTAGSLKEEGYIRITIDGRGYYASRLAFLWMTGKWPTGLVDHDDTNRQNDRWENLREATYSTNGANRNGNSGKSLPKGVTMDRGRFRAMIRVSKRLISLGSFDTAAKAHEAYKLKALEVFGKFAKLSAIMILILAWPMPGKATDDKKINLDQAQKLLIALRNLDGHMIVVKQNGADNVVMDPWHFGSAKVRLRISNDINVLEASLKVAQTARQGIFLEAAAKATKRLCDNLPDADKPPKECVNGRVNELRPGMPEFDEYDRQSKELDAQGAPGTQDLARIKASELNLDRNEIPGTVLSALEPILDNDVR